MCKITTSKSLLWISWMYIEEHLCLCPNWRTLAGSQCARRWVVKCYCPIPQFLPGCNIAISTQCLHSVYTISTEYLLTICSKTRTWSLGSAQWMKFSGKQICFVLIESWPRPSTGRHLPRNNEKPRRAETGPDYTVCSNLLILYYGYLHTREMF